MELALPLCSEVEVCTIGKAMFICDSAESSLLLCSGVEGCVKLYDNMGKIYDSYNIHTGEKLFTLDQAISLMRKVCDFDKKCKEDVRRNFNIHTQLQGPQRCVSQISSDCIIMLHDTLKSLKEDFPQLFWSDINEDTQYKTK